MKGYMFVSVEFPEDPNVEGRTYWYLCELGGVDLGTRVIAPLGSHNRLQVGVVRRVLFADGPYAPYPIDRIKRIEAVESIGGKI